jgi:phthalate 4,5-dioxygenase reductase subunit
MDTPVIVNPDADSGAADASMDIDFFDLLVTRKEEIARGVHLFELSDPNGAPLPAFTAGSHLTLVAPNGSRRNYSISSAPAQRLFYEIAVKREEHGRGGSASMADDVHAGRLLRAGPPRNSFALAASARKFVFVAGGIGITPILSMMRHLAHTGADGFRLYYLTRDAEGTAFLDELAAEFPGRITVHHDQGRRERAYDLWPVFERPAHGQHVYCCGPKGLMDSVRGMTGHWNASCVHFESFGADVKPLAPDRPFMVELHRSGTSFEVGAGESILEALRDRGYRVPSSCESGTCGSCRIRLLAGEAEHRDAVLGEAERADQIMVCVSRAKSPRVVLDI